MTPVTQPLRDEHRDLLPFVDAIGWLADSIGQAPTSDIMSRLDTTLAFLTDHLLIHAQAEEQVLYPVIADIMGAQAATATMRRDHVAIHQFTTELRSLRRRLDNARLTPDDERSLRRLLYGLHALVRVHFAKEEEVFLPMLDAGLTPDHAHDVFAAMESAAGAIRAAQSPA